MLSQITYSLNVLHQHSLTHSIPANSSSQLPLSSAVTDNVCTFLTGTVPAGQRLQKRFVVRQNLIPILAARGSRVHTSFDCLPGCAKLAGVLSKLSVVLPFDAVHAGVLSKLVVVLALGAVRAGGFGRAPTLVVVLSGGARYADPNLTLEFSCWALSTNINFFNKKMVARVCLVQMII